MTEIRKLQEADVAELRSMMRVFYDSPAILSTVPDTVITADIAASFDPKMPVDCYVFIQDGCMAGYSIITTCYAAEYGGMCAWIEDLYIKPEYRGQHISSAFFDFMEKEYAYCILFKLEAEKENETAVAVYKHRGFEVSDYYEMTNFIHKKASNTD